MTNGQERIRELIARWRELRAAGQDISIDELCSACPDLIAEVRKQTEAVVSMEAFLHQNTASQEYATLPPTEPTADCSHTAVSTIPGYVIEGELGRGGMGVVYKARQLRPSRTVALKMILAGAHASEQDLARFLAEAEAIAKLQHPNIVQIHEVGQQGGQPFFSLEYCDGGSLAGKLAGTPLKPREAAELLGTLAIAVQAAHDAGIIHRDLKPHNVLMLGNGTPKVTDFGLAKQAGSEKTATGAIVGTPSYMAPEQADGTQGPMGPATDVYALGAILYECLTGRPPFKAATALDTVMQVLTEEPVPPRQLIAQTPRDLETIALKCLQKDPRRRYPTAAELAADVQRFLDDEPIHARRVGRLERGRKWMRRHPAKALLTIVLIAVAAAIFFGLPYISFRESLLRREAKENEDLAIKSAGVATRNEQLAKVRETQANNALQALKSEKGQSAEFRYATRINRAYAEWQALNCQSARKLLDECPVELRGWEWDFLKWQFDHLSLPLRGHSQPVTAATISPDGTRAYTISADKTAGMWDARTGERLGLFRCQPHQMALSPDGTRLALAVGRGVIVCDAGTLRDLVRFETSDVVCGLGFVRGGSELAVAAMDGLVTFRSPESGQELSRIPRRLQLDSQIRNSQVLQFAWLTFSPDGSRAAQGGGDSRVRVWDTSSGEQILDGLGHIKFVGQVAFRPDGKQLASPGGEGDIRIWDLERKELVRTLRGHRTWAWCVSYSGDGKRLISGAKDMTARIWDAETGDALLTLRGHNGEVWGGVALNADGTRGVTASSENVANVWDTSTNIHYGEHVNGFFTRNKLAGFSQSGNQGHLTFYSHVAPCAGIAISKDGRYVASSAFGDKQDKHQITVWDLQTRTEIIKIPGPESAGHELVFSPDGKALAIGSGSDSLNKPTLVRLFEFPGGKELWRWEGPPALFTHLAWSRDGKQLAVVLQATAPGLPNVSPDGKHYILGLDTATGGEQFRQSWDQVPTRICYSPDGKELITAEAATGMVQHLNPANGERRHAWQATHLGLSDLTCSRDGILATADLRAVITLWNLADQRKLRELEGHVGIIMQMVFSPDGSRLFTGANDLTARLWNVETGRELLTFRDHVDIPWGVAWSPDGSRIGTTCKDGAVRLWESPRAEAIARRDDWQTLYQDDFTSPEALKRWTPILNSKWDVRDGVLRGEQIMHQAGVTFSVAQATLNAVELPRTAEITLRFRASKPLAFSASLTDAVSQSIVYAPLVAGRCSLQGSPAAYVMQITRPTNKIEDMLAAVVGIQRKFDMEAGRWYEFRELREPERLRVWIDGVALLDERITNVDLPFVSVQGSWSNPGDVIEIDEFVLRAPAEAVREQQLRKKVREEFARVHVRSEVVRRLAESPDFDTKHRPLLERLVLEFREEPETMAGAAWEILRKPDQSADAHQLALLQCEAALKARPGRAPFTSALALARLRVGQHEQACTDAAHAIELSRREHGAAEPIHHVILALAKHRLGKPAEAEKHRHHLRDLLRSLPLEKFTNVTGFVQEVDNLLGPARDPTPSEAEADALTKLILQTETAGWLRHDLAAYLPVFTSDVTVRTGRSAQPGPHDVLWNRTQIEAARRIDFQSPAIDRGFSTSLEDVRTEITGDTAEWRARWTTHLGVNFQTAGTHYRLTRTPGGWRIAAVHTWPLMEKQGNQLWNYEAEGWAAFDSAADKLTSPEDSGKRVAALRKARRWMEALELLRENTATPSAGAEPWVSRGRAELQLGLLDEAGESFSKAEVLDPSMPLPWNATRLRLHFRGHGAIAGGVQFLPDGERLFSSGWEGQGRLWRRADGKEERTFTGFTSPLPSAATSPDGKLCAAGSTDIRIWETASGKELALCKGHTEIVYRLHFSPDGKRLVSASKDKTARVWNAATGKELLKITAHTEQVMGAVFSPDGKLIATCSMDRSVRLWNADTGEPVRTIEGHTNGVQRVAFSPDGSRLATCSADRTVRVWDVATGKQLLNLAGHATTVDGVCFSPDGKRIASCDFGAQVRVWDAVTGKLQLQFNSGRGQLFAVCFSPDHRTLAACGTEGVYLWNVQPNPLVD